MMARDLYRADSGQARQYDRELEGDGDYLGTWTSDLFPVPHRGALDLWDTNRTDWRGQSIVRYRLVLSIYAYSVTFEGEDFSPSPMLAIDSDAAAGACIAFFAAYADRYSGAGHEGDEDAPDFTHEQWDALRANADGLSMWAAELEEENEG